ncbi:PREDICTED: centrosomal protein of 164 kDa [Bactrocera latifrons]|uniref:centrosomal protein of 164 kDa n=1 Tax=Bactrocera latifrons TaxID=174628 RepID=UPI0008DE8053|nr:PREDICTED: centrosomal protein of 164 kDa [Bactrocera latifrons]XP_018787221.1 PREDICTED: centrosomal protein of 164 kDa [Bactrocera latifrons]
MATSNSVSASGSASASTSASTSGNTGIGSPSTSVICEEVFDETEPSAEEIHDYSLMVGIDPVKEPHLLYLAKEGLMQALPTDWKICYSEEKCGHYYYNIKTKQSQWDHPLDAVYRELVEQARQKHTAIAATPVIDNSDDASQLDSGIRSLQGNDECDNTNNTNEMSSPVSNVNTNCTARSVNNAPPAATGIGANAAGIAVIGLANNSGSTSNSTSTSGFSGGVSRFLESRSKNFGLNFQPVKGSRFEVSKTNPQITLAMKFGGEGFSSKLAANKVEGDSGATGGVDKRAFVLSGTGAMFLKSRKQMETGLNQATASMLLNSNSNNIIIEGTAGTPPGVKGILRDSSLTDMRRRFEKDDAENQGLEDKKSVRFNLDETKIRGSPEEDQSSSRKITQSPEASMYSDDDDVEDDDPWDDDNDDGNEGCVGYDVLGAEGGLPRSLNPFLMYDEAKRKEIQIISVPKAQTIQMLKAQSFSMDLPERDRAKLSELARSQSTESGSIPQPASVVSYLEKLKDNSTTIKPMYEDTDSESKGSSVRSFIINKSEQDSVNSIVPAVIPFEGDENVTKNNRELEQIETKAGTEKPVLRTLKVASKLVSFLKKDTDKAEQETCVQTLSDRENDKDYEIQKQKAEKEKEALLKEERERLEDQLQREIDAIKIDHEHKLESIRQEYDSRLTTHRQEMEQTFQTRLNEYRAQLEEELNTKRKMVVDEHKAHMVTLQKNHTEILQDLERDLKSEEEIIKKEHTRKHSEMRDKLAHELELERQRMRETGEDRLYEKVRCEKRLLEDKYRCLKEKYVRLKTDVKLSLERRNRRREAQALHQQSLHTNTTTTGSETERSISNKPSIGNSENRSLSLSTSCQEHGGVGSIGAVPHKLLGSKSPKPPVPPKTHLTPVTGSKEHLNSVVRERSNERGQLSITRKPGIASKYIKHLQVQDDTTTSISQSDTTISNNYSKGRYLPAPLLSDNGNSDSEAAFQCNQENNNNGRGNSQRKKIFSRLKSASTSRLNSDNYKNDRPCTPVENLRHQLQKLEDLEDQFPDNTLDTTYHLRYPFSDISNDRAGAGNSSELEFFKHRIHLERDSVRRAKESLRTQRTNFRSRQREIKQRHKASTTRHSLDQLIQEEKELTEMEVNLHRTRALLGEKVIRLRHLEQSLLRIYEKEKPTMDLLGIEQKDDATLSDLSSHSSSGFSSTDFASGADTHNLHKRKENYHQESTECIQNLEILNAEIREILDILGKSQHGGIPMISPSELNWSHMLSTGINSAPTPPTNLQNAGTTATLMHAPQSIPTLADRLETYRQLATGRMQNSMGGALLAANTIVSQSPRAVNYTTSLVERTRDLRNWLRQAKTEHELLTGGSNIVLPMQHSGLGSTGSALGVNTVSILNTRECGGNVNGTVGVGTTATTGGGGGTATQTNL